VSGTRSAWERKRPRPEDIGWLANDTPSVVGEDENEVEGEKGRSGNGEKVDGRHVAQVIVGKRYPRSAMAACVAWPACGGIRFA